MCSESESCALCLTNKVNKVFEFSQKNDGQITTQRTPASIAHPKQEEALFSPVTILRLWWNKWNNCGNSAPEKKRNPADGGGGEKGE